MAIGENFRTHLEYLQAIKNNAKGDFNCLQGESFETRNPLHWTPLHYAAAAENCEYARTILKARNNHLSYVDKYGRTALSISAARGNLELTKLLLENKIDVTIGLPVCYATLGGNKDCVLEIINFSGNVNEEDLSNVQTKYTPAIIAVIENNVDILKILLKNGADVTNNIGYDMTALHFSCHMGRFDCLKVLLTKNIDLSVQCADMLTPLDYAILEEHLDIVQYLLEKGSPVHTGHRGRTPLHTAVTIGNEYVLELLKHGASVNAQDLDGETPLYEAVYTDRIDENIVKALLANGADGTISAYNSWTPLHMSCIEGKLRCVRDLLNTLNAEEINAVTQENITPLYVAAAYGHLEVCKELLDKGAFINVKINCFLSDTYWQLPAIFNTEDFKEGFDARDIAELKGHTKILELFRDYQNTNTEHIDVINYVQHNDLNGVDKCISNLADTDVSGWTCLHHAVEKGNYNMIQKCIKNGANVNAIDKYDRTPVAIASAKGKLEILRLLIDNGGDPSIGNPLLIAVDKGYLDCICYLLDNGADINKQDKRKQSPLIVAVKKNDPASVKELLKRNADMSIEDQYKEAPIHTASLYGFNECLQILIENGANVNYQNSCQDTALMIAAALENPDGVKLLLTNGADINIVDRFNDTSLHSACDCKSLESVKEILKYSPNVNAVNADHLTPLFLSVESVAIFKLLIEQGADYNTTVNGGWTILHVAAFKGNLDTFNEILKLNVDINALTTENVTPLYVAAARGHLNIVSTLIEQGCIIDVPVEDNLSDRWCENRFSRRVYKARGATPLLAAVNGNYIEVVKYLLNAGATISTVLQDGSNALTIAVSKFYIDLFQYLIKAGFLVDESLKTKLIELSKDNAELILQIEAL